MSANLDIRIQATDAASAVFGKVSSSAGGLGSKLTGAIGGGVRGLVSGFGAVGLAAQGLGVAFEGVKSVGGSVFGLGALNEMEQMNAKINAFTKDAGVTADILDKVRDRAAKTPFAFGEMGNATAALLPISKATGTAWEDLLGQAEILAASNPMEGLEGASFALKEAMTGDFTSIIERFNLSRSSINQWKSEGVSNFEIVQRAMKEMGMDSDLVAAMGETLQGRWSTFQDTMTTLAMRMGQPIFDALKEGLVGVQGALESNMPLIQGFADLVAGGLATGIAIARDAFATIVQVFQGDWSPDASINPIVNAIGNLAVVARDVVIPALMQLGAFIMEQLGVVVGWVTENWPLIQQTFEVVGAAVVAIVQTAWPVIREIISLAIAQCLDVIKLLMQLITGDWAGAWDTAGAIVTRSMGVISAIVGTVLGFIGNLIASAATAALTVVTDWMGRQGEAISAGMEQIAGFFSAGWEAIKSAASTLVEAVRTAILAVWNLLPEDIRKDLVLVATAIVTAGATWVTNMTTAGQAMWTAITGKLTEMVSAVTTWATETFLAPITGLAGTAETAATTVGTNMLTAITGKLGEIISAVQTWADSTFLAPLRGLAGTVVGVAESIGQAIVNGIVSGINSIGSSIGSTLAGLARGALSAAKAELGIESPSRVFAAQVGVPIGQGLIRGLLSTRGDIDSTLTGLVQPPALQASFGGLGGGGGGSGANGGNTNVYVTVQGSLIHERELPRLVNEALGSGLRRGIALGGSR